MREIKADRDNILINGHRVHLRGTVENAVFPKTGYAPVDDASWERILTILKDYGMNFTGKAEIYNYSPSALKNAKFKWWVTDADGKGAEKWKAKNTKYR